MNLRVIARSMIVTAICMISAVGIYAAEASESTDLAASVKEVEQAEAALAKAKDPAEIAAFWAEGLIDIHSSGWRYTKTESLQIGPNLRKMGGIGKAVKCGITERKVVPINKDTVAIETVSEIYFQVPNPQDVAKEAGTMTFDPDAMVKAAAAHTKVPGSGDSPQVIRNRTTTVWARIDGRWQIVLRQASEVGPRVVPGQF